MYVAKTEQDLVRLYNIHVRYKGIWMNTSLSQATRELAHKRSVMTRENNVYHKYNSAIIRDRLVTKYRDNKRQHDWGRNWGRSFAEAYAAERPNDVLELLGEFTWSTRIVDELIDMLKESSSDYEDLYRCASCGKICIDEDRRYSDSYDGDVCESCAGDHVYTSDENEFLDPNHNEVYWAYTSWSYSRGQFEDQEPFSGTYDLVPIHPSEVGYIDYVTEHAASDSGWLLRDDSDGFGVHPGGQDKREGVYQYGHHPYRKLNGYFDMPKGSSITNIPVGMELEVYCEGDILDATTSAGVDWILEKDGSLDSQYGVEIVSPPLLYSQWQEAIPKLCEYLDKEDTTAYDTEGDYGIHLTIYRGWLTPLQEARMLMFLLAQENAEFVRAIAQRWDIYNSSYRGGIGVYPKERQRVKEFGYIDAAHQMAYTNGKYMPLRFKGFPDTGLAEFRIFQSTIAGESIIKDIQFVLALTAWTNVKSATGKSWYHTDFYKWLLEHKNTYPDLVVWLQKDKYRVKHSITEFDNTWK